MPRRLTLLIDSLASGGAQTQLRLLAENLDPAHWQPTIAFYNPAAGVAQVAPQVTVRQLPRTSRTDPRFPLALYDLLSRRHSDVVHAFLGAPSAYAALLRQLPGRAPLVSAVRCSVSFLADRRSEALLHGLAGHLGDRVTVNSRDVVPWLRQRGVPEAAVRYVPNMLPPAIAQRQPSTPAQQAALLQQLGLDPARPPVLQVGRFDAFKNQLGLLDAWLQVRARRPDVPPLLLVGAAFEPSRVDAVRQRAAEAGVAAEVHVVPPTAEVHTLMEAARVNVLASRSEGTPNVVLEALGLGRVVVATRVGEVPELVRHGDTGLVVPPDDTPALAAGLEQALALGPDAAADMGARARADMLARFAAPAVVAQYVALYDELAAGSRPVWWRRLRLG